MNPKHSADPALPTLQYTSASKMNSVVSTRRQCVTRHSGCGQCVTDSVCHPGPRASFCHLRGGVAGHRPYIALHDVTILHYSWWYTTYLVILHYITLPDVILHNFTLQDSWWPTIHILPLVTTMKNISRVTDGFG